MAHLNHNIGILPRKSNLILQSSFEDGMNNQHRVFFHDSILIAETPSDMAKVDSSIYEAHILGEKSKRNKSS